MKGIRKKKIFQVVDSNSPSLLSGHARSALKLIACNAECMRQLSEVKGAKPTTTEDILSNYEDIFSGLGKLSGEYKIEIDQNVKPMQNHPRRVPLPLKTELKRKLEEMVNQGVIAGATEPTLWINNLVVIRKPNKLRICINLCYLIKAIRRNHYPTPTVEEIATKMKKARHFSIVDAKDGFLKVVLDELSSYLTTCRTPFGRMAATTRPPFRRTP